MKFKSSICDLCGKKIECGRRNGWQGDFRIKGFGNASEGSCISKRSNDKGELELCYDCGVSIKEHVESLAVNFTVKAVVTVEEADSDKS